MVGKVIDDPWTRKAVSIRFNDDESIVSLTGCRAFDIPSRRWRYFCTSEFQPNRSSSRHRLSLETIHASRSCSAERICPCQSKSKSSFFGFRCAWFLNYATSEETFLRVLRQFVYLPYIVERLAGVTRLALSWAIIWKWNFAIWKKRRTKTKPKVAKET